MERFTDAAMTVLGAGLLFFILLSSCMKTSSSYSSIVETEKEEILAYRVERMEHPLRKHYIKAIPLCSEKKIAPHQQTQMQMHQQKLVKPDSFPTSHHQTQWIRPDTLMVKNKVSFSRFKSKTAKAKTITLSENLLAWLRLLPFIPLGIGLGLMQRKMKGMQKENADVLILGGLISLLIVILLIVLIINLL